MVLNRQNKVRVELAPLETFLKKVRTVARIANREVTVCLVSDAEMARMNRAYRRKRGPTDVLSFPATATKCGTEREPQGFLGDIAIAPEWVECVERLRAKAKMVDWCYCGEFLSDEGAWCDGSLLVMNKHSELPPRCVKTNQPTDRRLRRKLGFAS